MASGAYKVGLEVLLDNDVSTLEANLWLMLIQDTTPAFSDSQTKKVTDVVTTDGNTEATFTNYTTNGIRLSVGGSEGAVSLSTSVDATPDLLIAADVDITWASAGNGTNNTIYAALLYYAIVGATPNYANDLPVILYDFSGSPITTNSGDLTFNWGLDGATRVVLKL